ncbi:DNA-binding NarL/FixJ family response regulator [Mycobacterium frederiksbergense]|uniref:DNA-binding NarL/FixJ family response regulator n=1 Tax=Mycolicibacterium frederiksbergense TaxID=117567 RepID=A0ABT6KZY9_9MYCO|nr:response regulator transcription factor [Mycolicibacterium frederiksbergense]MDH6196254.1 DNA-binding NarL/FixJ family response regulator [Mycolicibacterium frederiksbergense]
MTAMNEISVDLTTADQPESVYGPPKSNGWHPAKTRLFPTPRDELRDRGLSPTLGGWTDPYGEVLDGLGLLRDARVLVVDDCTLYRDFLVSVLVSHGAVAPGVAWDLPSLMAAVETTLPWVVVLNMGTRDSAALLRRALSLGPQVRVVVLGVSEDDESEIVACAEAGVAGYHLRTDTLQDLLALIHKVAAGESLCSPRVSAILLRRLSLLASQRQPTAKELVLTAREIQILRMLELGLANREIADELCIAVHTVKNHVHSLLTKLGVSSRAQAAALARTILVVEDSSEI